MKQIISFFALITIFACSSDNENRSLNAITFTDVYSVEADSLELDLIGDNSENAFYLTYSADNGYNENLLKYDLTSQIPTEIVHPDMGESTQLEIVNNLLYSVAKSEIYRYDLDLSNETVLPVVFGFDHMRTETYNDNIWMLPGMNQYLTYNTTSNNFTWDVGITDDYWSQAAFEIINDKAYCFGGANYYPAVIATNKIHIYDYLGDNWTEQTLPFNVFESFTATYNNSIIVAGNKNIDSSQPFLYIFNPATNSFSELATTFDFTGKTIRGVAIVNQGIYIAYAEFPITSLITIKIAKGNLP